MLTVASLPTTALAIDCQKSSDPVADYICHHSQIRALDQQLNTAYQHALQRDPKQVSAIREMERLWLGDRDRYLHSLLGLHSIHREKYFADFYRSQILFLNAIQRPPLPHSTAQAILHAALQFPKTAHVPLKALQQAGVVVMPRPSEWSRYPIPVITRMAAPPSKALRSKLSELRWGSSLWQVVYLPKSAIGGAYNIEGTGNFSYWVPFEKQRSLTTPLRARSAGILDSSLRDGGSEGYLAILAGHTVALNTTHYYGRPGISDLFWRRWLGGNHWAPIHQIRFRYATYLSIGKELFFDRKPCSLKTPDCKEIPALALRLAQKYYRNPFTLLPKTAVDKQQFQTELDQLAQHKNWGSCWTPTWFPIRWQGQSAIGGIVRAHIGCHPGWDALEVDLWGLPSVQHPAWHSRTVIDIHRGRLLLVVNPSLSASLQRRFDQQP